MTSSVGAMFGLFVEGLLSFFSPCVLPLVPLYIGYLMAGREEEAPGKRRRHTIAMTFCFVLGICTVFFLAGMGSNALREFFNRHEIMFQLIGGFLFILLGLFSMSVIRIPLLEREYRAGFDPRKTMTAGRSYLMGFFFSFAWSPCIGPLLASAIAAAAMSPSPMVGWFYIGAYSLGFILVFILLGLFTDEVLALLKKHMNTVKWTSKLGAAVVLGMGVYLLAQGMIRVQALEQRQGQNSSQETADVPADANDIHLYDFRLQNGQGEMVSFSDYEGQAVVLNFFGTWCTYCKVELPHLQWLEENRDDVKILLIAAPGFNHEGSVEYVEQWMADNGYTMEVLYDNDFQVSYNYGIQGYPTTFIMKEDGNFLGYIPGYAEPDDLDALIDQAAGREE